MTSRSWDNLTSCRDVYYRDPALFGTQAVVDRYVDSIAYTLNVSRAMLHVTAAAKGLVAGAFNVCRRDGSVTDATSDKGGLLVPALRDVLSIDMSAVKWILVIEKEASFRSIAVSSFWEDVSTRGVIMTGKGYPDIATRALLHFMATASPQNGFASPPVFCLADLDPDGLAITSTYKNGSAALAHENEGLRVPQMQWLGLRSGHLANRTDELHSEQGLLALTVRDRRKAINMLERGDPDSDDVHELEARSALQTMLMLNMKAELQLLDATPRGMEDLLTSALGHLD